MKMPNFKPICQGYRKITLSKMTYFTLEIQMSQFTNSASILDLSYILLFMFFFSIVITSVFPIVFPHGLIFLSWKIDLCVLSDLRGIEAARTSIPNPRFQGLPSSLLRSAPRKGRVETLETRLFNSRKKNWKPVRPVWCHTTHMST